MNGIRTLEMGRSTLQGTRQQLLDQLMRSLPEGNRIRLERWLDTKLARQSLSRIRANQRAANA